SWPCPWWRGCQPRAHGRVSARSAVGYRKTPAGAGACVPGTAGACSEVDAEAEAGGAFVAAERTAERERSATHALAVAHRQPALAALEAHAHGDAPAFAAGAGRVDRHVEHGRAHRAHAVDAAVLAVQAAVELVEAVLQHGHAVVEPARVEADQLLDRGVGVAVGRA